MLETLDVLPLAAENIDRAVTDYEHMRIRLDISTNLSQFPATKALCDQLPLPLRTGAGVVNTVPFPPEIPDPLGLSALLGSNEDSGLLDLLLLVSGCGLSFQRLPLDAGPAGDTYGVTMVFEDVASLPVGGQVRLGQSVVGRIESMSARDFVRTYVRAGSAGGERAAAPRGHGEHRTGRGTR